MSAPASSGARGANGPFILDPAPTFAGAARLSLPGGGESSLPVTWRHQTRSALQRWVERVASDGALAALLEVIDDWRVVTADGTPLPFERATLAQLLDAYPAAGGELCRAYVEALTESRLGN